MAIKKIAVLTSGGAATASAATFMVLCFSGYEHIRAFCKNSFVLCDK